MNHPNQASPAYAYVAVYDGRAMDVIADYGSCATAEQVADVIAAGGWVQRFPIEQAQTLRGQELHPLAAPPHTNLPACEAAARRVA
jgi:hypothetical protein